MIIVWEVSHLPGPADGGDGLLLQGLGGEGLLLTMWSS